MCLDTLQQLKNTRGEGYKFTLRLFEDRELQNAEEIIVQTVTGEYPNARQVKTEDVDVDSTSKTIIFKVPAEGFRFSRAFELLHDRLKAKNIIEDFSIAQASLEEIFIHLSAFQIGPATQ